MEIEPDTRTLPAVVRRERLAAWLPGLALIGILALAGVLEFWRLDGEGTANAYYAAAVRSMAADPVAFLFAGFDAGGYITLDKPPLGFQLQAISVAIFGFGGVALLLPQVLATIGSVGLLAAAIRPAWGTRAALVAALALALTPVSVAVGRNNTPDSTLVFFVLAAAWALTRGLRTGHLRWLLAAMALVGAGFEIKMLQAWLVLPAMGAAWFLAARGPLPRRAAGLALGAVPLAAVSFWWAATVALWPAANRPWIGGSSANSLFELALDYNGLDRLSGGIAFDDLGTPGPLRFLEPVLASQTAWLLPLAALGALLALPALRRRLRTDTARTRARAGSLLLWGGWLATTLVFFSIARFWHRHYLVMVAPAVAALAGIGVTLAWQALRRGARTAWLLPPAVIGTALLAHGTIRAARDLDWLADPVLLGGLLVALGIATVIGSRALGAVDRRQARAAGGVLVALLVAVALVPPAAWSAWTAAHPSGSSLPTGGPAVTGAGSGVPGANGGPNGGFAAPAGRPGFGGPAGIDGGADEAGLLGYLVANRGNATWMVAVASAQQASPLIISTGIPVMALGGFNGGDPAITLERFQALVHDGKVRFVAGGGQGGAFGGRGGPGGQGAPGGSGGSGASAVLAWAAQACAPVSAVAGLYDCAGTD